MTEPRYILTDHVCRACEGRILQQTNSGATGGGNPIFRCADCDTSSSGNNASCLCWCGHVHRNGANSGLRCIPMASAVDDPAMAYALIAAGFHPEHTNRCIGVYSPKLYSLFKERADRSRVDTKSELATKIADRLVLAYDKRKVEVAKACDVTLDRSGNLLGWVRDYYALSIKETQNE